MIEEDISLKGAVSDKDAALAQAGSSARWLYKNGLSTETKYCTRIQEQLEAMKWRFRIQEKFFSVMERLRDEGLIDPRRALRDPISWGNRPWKVIEVRCILEGFTLIEECTL